MLYIIIQSIVFIRIPGTYKTDNRTREFIHDNNTLKNLEIMNLYYLKGIASTLLVL